MASKQPTAKETKQESAKLKPETEEKVEVKQLLKDERTHKIAGAIFILIAILLFVSFTSYLFTWENDGKYFNQWRKLLMPTPDIQVDNLLGTFGVLLCALFINYGFGIASYLLCTFFFVVGINLFFGKKVFSIVRNVRYVLLGLVVLSVAASVIGNNSVFSWGGEVGDMIKEKNVSSDR
jgi:S-DNA-T family DNA segregation ATPase FtsK/SpoIIIE